MDDGQKTPRGHPVFNSYVKILRVLVFRTDGRTDGRMDGWIDERTDGWADGRTDGRTDGQTDRQTDREVYPVWASLTTFLHVNLV
jgi:hypothetical protein